MPDFIPGLTLSGLFYNEAVKPVLESGFPAVKYTAGIIGSGSEVLGFDTSMSSDHHWGPRLMLFLLEEDYAQHKTAIQEALRHKLPRSFLGYSTNFSAPDPNDNGVQHLLTVDSGPVNHRVEIYTIRSFFTDYLNFDPAKPIEPADWLTFPEQKLRATTAGEVYYDGIELNTIRSKFTYYPPDVWMYLLAAGWTRIGQEEHLMGRAGYVGDELGSQLIASRLVRDMMRLCFLMERQYAPYPKWFGTAFSQLECAGLLQPIFQRVLTAGKWQERERHLSAAYTFVAEMHNMLNITDPLPTDVSNFFGRPFQVIHADKFASAIKAAIQDETVKRIADKTLIGSVDQFSDNTDFLENQRLREKIKLLYE
jgi:hypothetical protein